MDRGLLDPDMFDSPDKPAPGADLKDALDNLKEAVELFCLAYGEARQGACPLGAGLEALERRLSEEDDLLRHPPLAEKRAAIERRWQEWLRIPRNREARVEIALTDHHGHGVLLRYAHRLAQTASHYLLRIGSHHFEPARRRLIMPQTGGRIVIVTAEDAGYALECLTTAREDWQTGVIASYLKMANPALLGGFTIG
jgi:hypothetical protein